MRGAFRAKTYIISWHSKYIDEINSEVTTIKEIVDKMYKTMKDLEKLKQLEDVGKIKAKLNGALNPIYIEIMDPSVDSEVARNPIVETTLEQ
jgi:hypothetical protein